MKAISIVGLHNTGKTTVCEAIISELKLRGFSVASIKEIHIENFAIDDKPSSNSNRHRLAGSELVSIRSDNETDVMYPGHLPISKLLSLYEQDFVILEGVTDCNIPMIITGKTIQDVKERMDDRAVAISGIVANDLNDNEWNLPVIDNNDSKALADLVIENAFEPLYDFDADCCAKCGHTCREMASLIAKKKATRNDCVLNDQSVHFEIDGKEIPMVPFVQRILKNAVLGVASELQGFEKNSEITVKFKV